MLPYNVRSVHMAWLREYICRCLLLISFCLHRYISNFFSVFVVTLVAAAVEPLWRFSYTFFFQIVCVCEYVSIFPSFKQFSEFNFYADATNWQEFSYFRHQYLYLYICVCARECVYIWAVGIWKCEYTFDRMCTIHCFRVSLCTFARLFCCCHFVSRLKWELECCINLMASVALMAVQKEPFSVWSSYEKLKRK